MVCLLSEAFTVSKYTETRVRFPDGMEFFIDIILPAVLWPWG